MPDQGTSRNNGSGTEMFEFLQDAGHVEHYAQMQEPLSPQHAKRQHTCVGGGGSTTTCTKKAKRG